MSVSPLAGRGSPGRAWDSAEWWAPRAHSARGVPPPPAHPLPWLVVALTWVGASALAAVAVLLLVIAAGLAWVDSRLDAVAADTTATVLAVDEDLATATLSFSTGPGSPITARVPVRPGSLTVGQQVAMEYDPASPGTARLAGGTDEPSSTGFAMSGLAAAGLASAGLAGAVRLERIRRRGVSRVLAWRAHWATRGR